MSSHWKLADNRTALFDFSKQLAILLRIDDIDAAAEHSDCRAAR